MEKLPIYVHIALGIKRTLLHNAMSYVGKTSSIIRRRMWCRCRRMTAAKFLFSSLQRSRRRKSKLYFVWFKSHREAEEVEGGEREGEGERGEREGER